MSHNSTHPLLKHNRDRIHVDRGVFKGSCFRTRCQQPGAVFYAQSTCRYYCEACALKLNRFNPPSEEMEKIGIHGLLCVSVDDPIHPYYGDTSDPYVPHVEDVRCAINNIFDEEEKVPKGNVIMEKLMNWCHVLDPMFLQDLIVEEVQRYKARRG